MNEWMSPEDIIDELQEENVELRAKIRADWKQQNDTAVDIEQLKREKDELLLQVRDLEFVVQCYRLHGCKLPNCGEEK